MSCTTRGMASRCVRAIFIAIVAVYGTYLVAANVLLRTHLLRGWLTRDGTSLLVDYSSARSLLPGSVVVHDLRIRHQDRAVQVSVHVDRASFDIDLLGLLRHAALFRHAKVEGVEYRMRQKLDTLDGNEGRARAFPLIDGLPASPLASLQPPLVDKPGPTWTIEVREVEGSVREAWTMEYRFRGAASLTGGFHIEPRRIVQVFPSTMHGEGVLSIGEEEVMKGSDWTIQAAVDPFAPDTVKGAEVMRLISATVHQHGELLGLAPFGAAYLPPDLALDEGKGEIGIDARVDHGIVQAGSVFGYHAEKVGFRAGGLAVATDLDVFAQVDGGDPAAPHVVATAKSAHGVLSPATDLRDLHAELALHGVDTSAPVVIDSLTGALGKADAGDLRAWNKLSTLHDAELTFTGGAATVSARADYEKGALTGHVDTKMDRLGLAVGPFSVVCSGTSSTDLRSADLTDALTFPGARVDIHDVSMKLLNSDAQGMWVRARSSDTRVATSGKGSTDSHIAVESGPGAQTTKLFTGLAHLPDIAADIAAGAQLEAAVHLRVRHNDVSLDIDRAKDGAIEGAGRLHHRPDKKPTGAFLVTAGQLSAGIDITESGVSVVPLATNEWLKETVAKR